MTLWLKIRWLPFNENIDYIAKITEIFYSVDEFCKQIEPQFKKKAIGKDGEKSHIWGIFLS